MNAQQLAFLRQARSDWQIFCDLRARANRPACHDLHFLQMATEKLAKAFLWGSHTPTGHAALVRFLRAVANKRRVSEALQMEPPALLQRRVHGVLPVAYQLERLAPDLAANGPNPEYPWPRELPTIAPADYDFDAWTALKSAKGRNLINLIDELLESFESWA
jgi:hypothetical protein